MAHPQCISNERKQHGDPENQDISSFQWFCPDCTGILEDLAAESASPLQEASEQELSDNESQAVASASPFSVESEDNDVVLLASEQSAPTNSINSASSSSSSSSASLTRPPPPVSSKGQASSAAQSSPHRFEPNLRFFIPAAHAAGSDTSASSSSSASSSTRITSAADGEVPIYLEALRDIEPEEEVCQSMIASLFSIVIASASFFLVFPPVSCRIWRALVAGARVALSHISIATTIATQTTLILSRQCLFVLAFSCFHHFRSFIFLSFGMSSFFSGSEA